MNLSSLSGESLAAILPAGSTVANYNISSGNTGVIVNFSGRGLFFIDAGSSSTIKITIDGIELITGASDTIVRALGFIDYNSSFDTGNRLIFKKSLKVEVLSSAGTNPTVTVTGA